MIPAIPNIFTYVFSDNPQMIGAHAPTAPNWEQPLAVYTICTGAGGTMPGIRRFTCKAKRAARMTTPLRTA